MDLELGFLAVLVHHVEVEDGSALALDRGGVGIGGLGDRTALGGGDGGVPVRLGGLGGLGLVTSHSRQRDRRNQRQAKDERQPLGCGCSVHACVLLCVFGFFPTCRHSRRLRWCPRDDPVGCSGLSTGRGRIGLLDGISANDRFPLAAGVRSYHICATRRRARAGFPPASPWHRGYYSTNGEKCKEENGICAKNGHLG